MIWFVCELRLFLIVFCWRFLLLFLDFYLLDDIFVLVLCCLCVFCCLRGRVELVVGEMV